jgi:perosamine synthetase
VTINVSTGEETAAQIIAAIRTVLGEGRFALHEPSFGGNEWRYTKECLDSTFVSSVGQFVDRFESDLAAFTGARHAIAVVNGTAALQVALQLAGVGPGDEVLVPALTFVGTAAAVVHVGAIPHFVEMEESTLGMDPVAVREYLVANTTFREGTCVNRRTERPIRAIVPMHTFGHPVNLDGVIGVSRDFNLALVEDAAESLGSSYHARHTGTFGVFGTLSFNGNKTITTGGGGAVLTDDGELARQAKHLTTTARLPHSWEFEHDLVGFNYRLPNLNAALGCAQLERLPELLAAKRRLAAAYDVAFRDVPNVRLFREPGHGRSNYWLQTLILDREADAHRDTILELTNADGLMTRPAWRLLPELAPYRACPRMPDPVAQSLQRRIINIPSSAHLRMPK